MKGAYAFLVSFLAGAATLLGGLVAIWTSKSLNARGFAVTLAFAAGVMTFVSFVEIYAQGTEYLEHSFEKRIADGPNKADMVKGAALSVGMALFFCGWIIANIMDCMVHMCMDPFSNKRSTEETLNISIGQHSDCNVTGIEDSNCELIAHDVDLERGCLKKFWDNRLWRNFVGIETLEPADEERVRKMFSEDCSKITRLGIFTALVLTLHNLPEGCATFSSAAADSKLGIGLGIAIAIHNIPEGTSVAFPILLGTGSKWKAFWYATISGMAEPLGGLITWLAIGETQGNMLMGILFLIIAGIMVNVSIKELLFAAIKYDPGNLVTSFAFTAGMVVMAISLTGLYLA